MDAAVLDKCQELVEYRFSDLQLLAQALTHASTVGDRLESNERLEFLGDAVLGLVVCHDLYEEYPDLLEGEMTKVKSLVVSREVCAMVAEESGLTKLLSLGKGMSMGDSLPQSVSGAAFESVIGAVYCDGGLEPARQYILRMIRPKIVEAVDDEHKRNYKSMLQQVAQRRWSTTPAYQLLDEKGPDHSKCFEIAVVINSTHFPSAWGTNKKQAEQGAAKRALIKMGLIDEDDSE